MRCMKDLISNDTIVRFGISPLTDRSARDCKEVDGEIVRKDDKFLPSNFENGSIALRSNAMIHACTSWKCDSMQLES